MRFFSSDVLERFIDADGEPRASSMQQFNACLACGAEAIEFLFRKSFFGHWVCRRCGYLFVNPRPSVWFG